MKTCTKCGESKPLTDFPKLTRSLDGHRERCRRCHSAAATEYKRGATAKASRKAHYEKNKDLVLEQSRAWLAANRERKANTTKAWTQANRARASYNARRYQLSRLRAIPPWADQTKTDAIYLEALAMRGLGIAVEVDHIVPLRGQLVSGLHWHGNLRLILSSDNKAKSNKLVEDLAVSM